MELPHRFRSDSYLPSSQFSIERGSLNSLHFAYAGQGLSHCLGYVDLGDAGNASRQCAQRLGVVLQPLGHVASNILRFH